MKKNIIVVMSLLLSIFSFSNFLTAEEYARGETIFEQPVEVMTLVGSIDLDKSLSIQNFNYGYGMNLGNKGLIMGFFSRYSGVQTLNLEYIGFKNYNFYINFLFKDWESFYGFGSSYSIDLFRNVNFKILLQGIYFEQQIQTLNIGSSLKIGFLELMAGQSDITLKEKTDLPFNLKKEINFGVAFDLGQLVISGAAKYDFNNKEFNNYKLSFKVYPFKKFNNGYYNLRKW